MFAIAAGCRRFVLQAALLQIKVKVTNLIRPKSHLQGRWKNQKTKK